MRGNITRNMSKLFPLVPCLECLSGAMTRMSVAGAMTRMSAAGAMTKVLLLVP